MKGSGSHKTLLTTLQNCFKAVRDAQFCAKQSWYKNWGWDDAVMTMSSKTTLEMSLNTLHNAYRLGWSCSSTGRRTCRRYYRYSVLLWIEKMIILLTIIVKNLSSRTKQWRGGQANNRTGKPSCPIFSYHFRRSARLPHCLWRSGNCAPNILKDKLSTHRWRRLSPIQKFTATAS